MKIDDLIPAHELREAVEGKLVRYQFHPERPELTILNYTDKAQVNNIWNRATKTCRGLVYDADTLEVLARPFPKFFNYGQEPRAQRRWSEDEMVVVTDKLDGSLGISYTAPDGQLAIATRGSFTSEQAVHATHVLRTRYAGFEPLPGKTYLFEIIYPENRIVVDYHGLDDLVLIGVVDIQSGLTFSPIHDAGFTHWGWPGPVVRQAPYKRFRDALAAPPRPNAEGLVVHFLDTDERVKIKQDDYVALHKIVTGLNETTVWEHMRSNNYRFESLQVSLPDEFHDWVHTIASQFFSQWFDMDQEVESTYYALEDAGVVDDRKEFALSIKDKEPWLKACLFAFLDGNHNRVAETIWKQLKPKADG